MRVIPVALEAELDALEQKGVWAHGFEIELGDTGGTVYRRTDHHSSVVIGADTFTPYPIIVEDIPETSEATLETFNIAVANIDRDFILQVENGFILGEDITVYKIFIDETNTVILAFKETFQVFGHDLDASASTIRFQVGYFNLSEILLPRNRWNDLVCNYSYKGALCSYGKDEFEGLSKLDFSAGGDGEKIQGWNALNIDSSGITEAGIDTSSAGTMTVRIAADTEAQWFTPVFNAPWLYQVYPNADFDYEMGIASDAASAADEDREQVGILIGAHSDNPTSWVYFARVFEGSQFHLRCYDMALNVQTTRLDVVSGHRALRIKKTGGLYEVFSKSSGTSTSYGEALTSFTNIETGASGNFLRMGMSASTHAPSTPRSTDFRARISFVRLLSGGEPTCDRALDSATGCNFHNNSRRFGAAPGILHGPLIL